VVADALALVDPERMSRVRRLLVLGLSGLTVAATVLALTYLVVACESLPAFMGGVAGDPHPRTKLGLALLGLAALLALVTTVAGRRRTDTR
jgi:hypothetical protein